MLISYAAPFMHACTYEKVPGQKGHTSLSSRYVYCRPIRLQKRGHMALVECNHEWSVRTPVYSAYAHRTEVAVNFHFTTPELTIIAFKARQYDSFDQFWRMIETTVVQAC